MAFHLTYFGKLMDVLGGMDETVDPPAEINAAGALRRWLDSERQLDGLLLDPTIRIAVNDVICDDNTPLGSGDRVAFMPPVGGG